MSGNRGRVGLILQKRDEQLLAALRLLRIVDREQAGRLAGFHSVRRTNARLLKLTRAGYLKQSFIGAVGSGRRALYRLPSDRSRTSPAFLAHQLALNDVYLHLQASGALLTYQTFTGSVAAGIPLIPDAYAELTTEGTTRAVFFEVDRGTESGKVWQEKARSYLALALSGEFERSFCHPRFRVAVLTTTPRREKCIRQAVAGVTDRLFWFSTFSILNGGSFFTPSWRRPKGEEEVPLL